MKKILLSLVILACLTLSFQRVEAQCNQDALAGCDYIYTNNENDLFDFRMEDLGNCYFDFLSTLVDFWVPSLPDLLGDIVGTMSQLLELGSLYSAADQAYDCLDTVENNFWNSWEQTISDWHNCEADPARGNCPNRHD